VYEGGKSREDRMKIICASMLALGLLAAPAFGQTSGMTSATPPAPQVAPLAIPSPHYETLVLEQAVDAPAAAVWGRIGRYCDIQEWFGMACKITSGTDGELGAVRELNASGVVVIEMLVAKTPLSYTYTQPVRVGVPYNAYHGTLEVQAVTAKTSKLVYSLFWDDSMLADDAARATAKANRAKRFGEGMTKMKQIVESKTPRP
jgi:hypothetical protein